MPREVPIGVGFQQYRFQLGCQPIDKMAESVRKG
jgi:hypothetical protein